MKNILLLTLAFMFIGFVCEWAFRIITDGSLTWKEKLQKLKLLIMMFVYGPACLLISLVYKIPFLQNITFLPVMMLIGGIIATGFEFGFGYIFNIKLKLNIWDYSHTKINLMGQIDLFHSLLWVILTIAVVYFGSIIQWLGA